MSFKWIQIISGPGPAPVHYVSIHPSSHRPWQPHLLNTYTCSTNDSNSRLRIHYPAPRLSVDQRRHPCSSRPGRPPIRDFDKTLMRFLKLSARCGHSKRPREGASWTNVRISIMSRRSAVTGLHTVCMCLRTESGSIGTPNFYYQNSWVYLYS